MNKISLSRLALSHSSSNRGTEQAPKATPSFNELLGTCESQYRRIIAEMGRSGEEQDVSVAVALRVMTQINESMDKHNEMLSLLDKAAEFDLFHIDEDMKRIRADVKILKESEDIRRETVSKYHEFCQNSHYFFCSDPFKLAVLRLIMEKLHCSRALKHSLRQEHSEGLRNHQELREQVQLHTSHHNTQLIHLETHVEKTFAKLALSLAEMRRKSQKKQAETRKKMKELTVRLQTSLATERAAGEESMRQLLDLVDSLQGKLQNTA